MDVGDEGTKRGPTMETLSHNNRLPTLETSSPPLLPPPNYNTFPPLPPNFLQTVGSLPPFLRRGFFPKVGSPQTPPGPQFVGKPVPFFKPGEKFFFLHRNSLPGVKDWKKGLTKRRLFLKPLNPGNWAQGVLNRD